MGVKLSHSTYPCASISKFVGTRCLFLSRWSQCYSQSPWFYVPFDYCVFCVPFDYHIIGVSPNRGGLVFFLIIILLMFFLIVVVICSSKSSWSCVCNSLIYVHCLLCSTFFYPYFLLMHLVIKRQQPCYQHPLVCCLTYAYCLISC